MAHQSARRGRLPLLALAVALAACGQEADSLASSCGEGEPALELLTGYGDLAWPVEEGGAVQVHCGSQGLRHVQIQLVATGVTPTYRYAASLRDFESGEIYGESAPSVTARFYQVDGACRSHQILLVIDALSSAIEGRSAILAARIDDEDGRAIAIERRVTLDTSRMHCEGPPL
ncbi:MAG: hypothetical protein AABZ30_08335 [Myxococcota bacterium]